ncbi:MAG TPA: hypothetical protein VGV09_21190 [Steroidobacteraceae bacterium]|nr:hypothetical protein [Steroidobacteraceae bacterium]
MKRILVPTRDGSDWQRLLAKPALHWKKGASAMPAAASWEAAAGALPAELSTLLDSSGVPNLARLELLMAIPEWETALEGGVTNSQTDVLAICSNASGLCAIAVEAKVNEDFGPLIGEKRRAASPGQSRRLEFLQTLLGAQEFNDTIRYQLLHRTAAALLIARQFHALAAVMLIQSFGNKPSLRADFDAFGDALGAVEQAPGLLAVRRFSAPALFLGWCDGDGRFLNVQIPSAPEFNS